jgi:hypothetical protein
MGVDLAVSSYVLKMTFYSKKEEVTAAWRKLSKQELYNLCLHRIFIG